MAVREPGVQDHGVQQRAIGKQGREEGMNETHDHPGIANPGAPADGRQPDRHEHDDADCGCEHRLGQREIEARRNGYGYDAGEAERYGNMPRHMLAKYGGT
jgi:hypothetical protein